MKAITFEQVSKRYDLGIGIGNLRDALPALASRILRRQSLATVPNNEFWALRDVSFELEKGEALGLVGVNGSGKSTMLKLLSKVTYPSIGNITVNGRVSALIELGAGFHPDLTGTENVYLNGSILGLSRKQIDERLDSIIEFSELRRFMDTPVKRYSSGMYLRLGFAVAVHVEPEILLIDEVLAVGDADFQEKCIRKIDEFRQAGKTMVIVSHSAGLLRRLSDRGLLLAAGRVVAEGPIDDVLATYQRGFHFDQGLPVVADNGLAAPADAWPIEVTRVTICDDARRPRYAFATGATMIVRIHYRANARVVNPVFYCDVSKDGLLLNSNDTNCFQMASGQFEPGDAGIVEGRYDALNLLQGRYYVTVGVRRVVDEGPASPVLEKIDFFEVTENARLGSGLVDLPVEWTFHEPEPLLQQTFESAIPADQGPDPDNLLQRA